MSAALPPVVDAETWQPELAPGEKWQCPAGRVEPGQGGFEYSPVRPGYASGSCHSSLTVRFERPGQVRITANAPASTKARWPTLLLL